MSRSQPTSTNPAKKFFSWKGGTGKLVYWDKEKSQEVEVKLPFEFLPLDSLKTITGYCEPDSSGYWSNEVRGHKDEMTVRTSKGVKYVGPYKNEQGIVQVPQGAKFAQSIYLAYKDGDEYIIGNLKASGAALNAWIDLTSTCKPENGKVALVEAQEAKKGATTYFVPVFLYSSATDSEDKVAVELDRELQVYLSQYLAVTPEEHINHEADWLPEEGSTEELNALEELSSR